jgi:hypothetical protein
MQCNVLELAPQGSLRRLFAVCLFAVILADFWHFSEQLGSVVVELLLFSAAAVVTCNNLPLFVFGSLRYQLCW